MARRLAVLIDGDNISAGHARALFDKIATLGTVKIRRVYCAQCHGKSWSSASPTHDLHCRRIGTPVPGKNAADIALVIDAMDLLRCQKFEGFCIVSSDGDFSRLALRLRKDKVEVFGFGLKKKPVGFQKACRKFFSLEEFRTPPRA